MTNIDIDGQAPAHDLTRDVFWSGFAAAFIRTIGTRGERSNGVVKVECFFFLQMPPVICFKGNISMNLANLTRVPCPIFSNTHFHHSPNFLLGILNLFRYPTHSGFFLRDRFLEPRLSDSICSLCSDCRVPHKEEE